jgi:hypothetical protein
MSHLSEKACLNSTSRAGMREQNKPRHLSQLASRIRPERSIRHHMTLAAWNARGANAGPGALGITKSMMSQLGSLAFGSFIIGPHALDLLHAWSTCFSSPCFLP